MVTARILLVEDDSLFSESLAYILQQEGYAVEVTATGSEALDRATRQEQDLVLLDVSLPDLSGVEVCRRLRTFSLAPVIFLTARRQEADKIVGLDAGGDDYLTKPVPTGELLARVRAHLRRARALENRLDPLTQGELDLGELWISLPARRVAVRGQPVDLSAREFDLLRLLAANAGRVVTRRTLIDSIWGPDFFGDERALDVYIRFLRKKIERDPDRPEMIRTVRGVGYRLEPVARA